MKKLGKLKLNQISKADLEKKEMNYLTGGDNSICACACSGTSSTVQNDTANDSYGYGGSGTGGDCRCACSPWLGENYYTNSNLGSE